eukprot:SAG11_NODE_25426_length_358_cov_38.409266_2_plen_58_part_01
MASVQQMGVSVMLGSSESCVTSSVRAIMGSVLEMGVSVQKDLGETCVLWRRSSGQPSP